MGLALNELPLTMRRVAGQMNVYPRLVRDGSMLPRISLAIDYFESLLGHERQQIEDEMLVELFGDPRLARAIAAALGHSYRFRPRQMDEVLGRVGAAHLKRVGLKHTAQRDTILRTFLDTREHLSTDELHRLVKRKDPKIGNTTVYRTLKLLAE